MFEVLMPCQRPDYQNDNRYQEDDDRDPVHAVHQEDVDISRLAGIALFQEEVLLDLIPDAMPGVLTMFALLLHA
jgi:hypothetical protein